MVRRRQPSRIINTPLTTALSMEPRAPGNSTVFQFGRDVITPERETEGLLGQPTPAPARRQKDLNASA